MLLKASINKIYSYDFNLWSVSLDWSLWPVLIEVWIDLANGIQDDLPVRMDRWIQRVWRGGPQLLTAVFNRLTWSHEDKILSNSSALQEFSDKILFLKLCFFLKCYLYQQNSQFKLCPLNDPFPVIWPIKSGGVAFYDVGVVVRTISQLA